MSPSRAPVFSCAHYFQAPATQALNFAAIATEAPGLLLHKMADAESNCLKNETAETLLELWANEWIAIRLQMANFCFGDFLHISPREFSCGNVFHSVHVLACSRLRDGGGKSFCPSYFRFARFNTFPLYYLRAWNRLYMYNLRVKKSQLFFRYFQE